MGANKSRRLGEEDQPRSHPDSHNNDDPASSSRVPMTTLTGVMSDGDRNNKWSIGNIITLVIIVIVVLVARLTGGWFLTLAVGGGVLFIAIIINSIIYYCKKIYCDDLIKDSTTESATVPEELVARHETADNDDKHDDVDYEHIRDPCCHQTQINLRTE